MSISIKVTNFKLIMLRNFLLVAMRNIQKNRLYSFVNISGLSIGIVCSFLIFLWVSDELTYNKFIPKHKRLYQVWINAHFDGTLNSWMSVPLPTYDAIKDADANIVNSVVTDWGSEHLLSVGEERLLKDGYWASKEFLEMFEYPLLFGDAETVMDDPSSIVITESLAKELFGDEDPVGQIVRVDDEFDVKVTGILKDIPANSTFEFEYLIPWKKREQVNEWVRDNTDNWGNNSFQVFIELNDQSNAEVTEKAVKNMIIDHSEEGEFRREIFLYPMERWRLWSNFENGEEVNGMIEYVQLFTVIAIAILAIACINFMNLSTARSEKRAKEVGIRKSIGSRRIDLIFQFLGESIIISTISYVLAILLIVMILPFFNQMVDKQLVIDFQSSFFWLLSGGIILLTGVLAGSYPAFFLSSFNPVKTIKGSVSQGKNASLPRKVLVILQFAVAIILLIGTVVIYQQIEMIQKRELGYDQDKMIFVSFTDELRNNYDALKNELEQSGYVESVTRSNSPITRIYSNNFLGWPGKPEDLNIIFWTLTIDYDYVETMGIDLLMGRDFSKEIKSDSSAIIINKTGLALMDLEDPIGTELDLWGEKRTLVGVVDDVLMGSVYEEVKPMFMILDDWGGFVTLRLDRNKEIQSSLSTVESILKKYNPAYPFDYSFADEDFERKFATIRLTSKLAVSFSILTILITGLGLFGLASYTAEQRTKEIGIRKVLGASVSNLVQLMSKDFTILVSIAFICSAPVAWWMLDNYLDRYPMRIEIQWWILPLAGLTALAFALLIVSNQARKAAIANPVKSLRSE